MTFRMEFDHMNSSFTKRRIYGDWEGRFHLNVNRFTSADAPDAEFHDHPFAFRSVILYGGYTEEVLVDGNVHRVQRLPGDTFLVSADHTHRICRLHADECWTLFLPQEKTQEVSFYRVRDGMVWRRAMGSEDWVPYSGKAVAA